MKLMDSLLVWLGCVFMLAIAGILIYLQIGVWNECRDTHSWWYCFNLMRK